MATIKSLFGAYSDRLQVMIDDALDQFAPTWYQQFFNWDTPQTQLTFVEAIGRSRIEAAASIIDRDSPAPLRSRPGLEKLQGEIPAIAEKVPMDQKTYREFLSLQAMTNVDEGTRRQQLLDLMFDDVKRVGNSVFKRLDIMCLEGLSTGQISLTVVNNPDGVILTNPIDLLMPAANKVNAAVNWATSATATPLTDIQTILNNNRAKGVSFGKILMTWNTWFKFIKTTEVKDFYSNYSNLPNNKVLPTADSINAFFGAQKWPPIVIVDETIGIEKDGVITTIQPWKDENVVFVPNGPLGVIKNALAMEQMKPVPQISYATFNRALISKWGNNEPWQELTKAELNAFPAITTIDRVNILSSNVAF
jgi:hypothetical protein